MKFQLGAGWHALGPKASGRFLSRRGWRNCSACFSSTPRLRARSATCFSVPVVLSRHPARRAFLFVRATALSVQLHCGGKQLSSSNTRYELRRLPQITEDTIIAEIRRVAAATGVRSLPARQFRRLGGKVSLRAVYARFGCWQVALARAGLEHLFVGSAPSPEGMRHRNRSLSPQQIVNLLRDLASKLGRNDITLADIESHSELRGGTIRQKFGSLANALAAAELQQSKLGRRYTDEQCFDNLITVWSCYGRAPYHREMSLPPSAISGKAYVARFGSWNKALAEFVRYTQAERSLDDPQTVDAQSIKDNTELAGKAPAAIAEADRRDVRLSLRFAVLQRDGFRCVACGSTPALDLGCVLHVDHIQPFSKGGKTTIENLRTLCAPCNIGRGNRFDS